MLRESGASLSPQNAFLFLQGLETLNLRIERHNENAKKVAEYLLDHPGVEWVNYPGLKDHPSHELANKYFNGGYGSIITFGIKGGRDAGRKLIDHIQLWSHVANVGDAKSLIIHPASTTHQQLSAEDLEKSGVSEELVRLAVGLEDVQDTLADLEQAIAKATGVASQWQIDESAVIESFFQSPFDRTDGLRQKSVTFIQDGQSDVNKKAQFLKSLGYAVEKVEKASQIEKA